MVRRCFDLRIEDQVAHIVLCRSEKRNSMIPGFWDELLAIVRDIEDNARDHSSGDIFQAEGKSA